MSGILMAKIIVQYWPIIPGSLALAFKASTCTALATYFVLQISLSAVTTIYCHTCTIMLGIPCSCTIWIRILCSCTIWIRILCSCIIWLTILCSCTISLRIVFSCALYVKHTVQAYFFVKQTL